MNRSVMVCFLALIAACKGEEPVDSDTDDAECALDPDCGPGNICNEAGECTTGDRDNDFESAAPLDLEQAFEAEIAPEGDVDYWSFSSPGDEWIRIETVTDEEEVNTVVSLLDPDRRLYAVMDDFPTGNVGTYDTVLHAYVPREGTWFVKIEDRGTFTGADDSGEGEYTLQIKSFTGTTDEVDALDDPGQSLELDDGSTIFSVGVNVDQAGDADFIEVSLPYEHGPVQVFGQADIPGSEAQVLVELIDPAVPDVVLARKGDVGPEGSLLYFDTHAQNYVLRATDADGEGGPDHWFVLYVRAYEPESFVYLEEQEPNDTIAESELFELVSDETNSGDPYDRFDFTGALDDANDEDWFSAEVGDGDFVTVWCTADTIGSLADLAIDVHLDGVVLDSGGDGDGAAPRLTNLAELDTGGLLSVRVYDESGAPAWGPGAYYACSVFLTPFEVTE